MIKQRILLGGVAAPRPAGHPHHRQVLPDKHGVEFQPLGKDVCRDEHVPLGDHFAYGAQVDGVSADRRQGERLWAYFFHGA